MYALPNKTQHNLIVKVRGGISQKLDNFNSTSATSAATSGNIGSTNLSPSSFSQVISSKEASSARHIIDSHLDAQISHLPQPVFQHGNKQKSSVGNKAQKQQYITPEHNEMIKYVQQSWKGVERDYKKSVNNFINNIDINNPDNLKQKQLSSKRKTATTSTPLLLSGSYHHSSSSKDSNGSNLQDAFQPFDLETFWGNRILKRLTEEI